MRVSRRGRYALRAMVDLARRQDCEPVHGADIAASQGISDPYLAQLFSSLARNGLVASQRGPGGGYALARPASEITPGDVMRAVGEELEPVVCASGAPEDACSRYADCTARALWERLGRAISEALDSVSLADLAMGGIDSDHLLESRVE